MEYTANNLNLKGSTFIILLIHPVYVIGIKLKIALECVATSPATS